MEGIVTGFVELVRNAVLSGFFVYALLFGMLLLTTLGSFGNWRKVAAYVLGWLAAIFAVVLITASLGGQVEAGSGALVSNHAPINPILLFVPAVFGGALGFALIYLPMQFGDNEGVRAFIIAVVTALAGTLLFLMSLTGGEVRALISSGTIAFAIGALVHIVMRGTLIKSLMETPVKQAN